MLMPAALLIVVVMGAIAVDLGAVHVRQRDLANAAAAAANDAVSHGLDIDHMRATGERRLDPLAVAETAAASVAARQDANLIVIDVRIIDVDQVEVTLGTTAEHILAPAIPGSSASVDLRATGRARLIPPP